MTKSILRIATRKSQLALWQANFVETNLKKMHPNLSIEIIGMVTQGDKDTSQPLQNIGGKSLFAKELQTALLENKADIAVHCVKDLSVYPIPGLTLGAFLKRGDARDAFVSNTYSALKEVPKGAKIGTSSPRRESLIKNLRPDLTVLPLRGNVNTRLLKLDNGNYDAIILAAEGLQRLNMPHRINETLDPTRFIPAIGQGTLCIECRENDTQTHEYIKHFQDTPSTLATKAERAVNQTLGGDCFTPVGAYATINQDKMTIRGMVGAADGSALITAFVEGDAEIASTLGKQLAQDLLKKGAGDLLNHAH